MDDLIIPAKYDIEALERLKLVLKTAQDYVLQINLNKCQFIKKPVEFLGYRIEGGKMYPSEEKIRAPPSSKYKVFWDSPVIFGNLSLTIQL